MRNCVAQFGISTERGSSAAVSGVRLADGADSLHTGRGHSLRSLYLPQAALPSLPLPAYRAALLCQRAYELISLARVRIATTSLLTGFAMTLRDWVPIALPSGVCRPVDTVAGVTGSQ